MAGHKFFLLASLVMAVSELVFGQTQVDGVDEVEVKPPYPPGVFNPINTITINSCCCNETEQDDGLREELEYIKELLQTIKTGLENGDYCCNESTSPPSTSPPSTSRPRDCYEVQQDGFTTSGVYTIYPNGTDPFDVYCDMDTDEGGWTIFQRRQDGSVEFFLDWDDYVSGFGALTGEHWLGNENLYYLSNQKTYRLRVDLGDFEEATRYAEYATFVIADASDNYRLSLGAYDTGDSDAGDAMAICDDEQFSTRDQDNDQYAGHCADKFKGGWWYEACHFANLNGAYLSGTHTTYADGVEWNQWRGYYYSLKFSEMKLRPV